MKSLLSACKFLDIGLILGREELEIHRWVFITETFEIQNSHSRLIALVDRLSLECQIESRLNMRDRLSDLGHSRPLLLMRHIDHKSDLCQFFSHLSAHCFYSLLDFDTCAPETIEEILYVDFRDP